MEEIHEGGICVDGIYVEDVDEVPEEHKIFNQIHVDYVSALTSHLLDEYKERLFSIIEGTGLQEKQENAVKEMVIACLYDAQYEIIECLELVTTD